MNNKSSGVADCLGGLLVFAIAILVTAAASGARAQDCSLKKMATLDMVKTASNVLAADVRLNQQTERLRLNLNGMYSGLTADEVTRLGLSTRRIENGVHMVTSDGTPIDHYAMVDRLDVGANTGTHVPFEIEPGTKTDEGIAGDLSADLLRNFDVDLDFGKGKINLFSPDHCPGKVVYWGADYVSIPLTVQSDGRASMPVTLDGHALMAELTTAAGPVLLDGRIASGVLGVNEGTEGAELPKNRQPGDIVTFRYRFKSLSLNGVEIRNPLVEVFDNSVADAALKRSASRMDLDTATVGGSSIDSPSLLIGLNVLDKLHVYIAYRERMVYLTAASAAQTPTAPH